SGPRVRGQRGAVYGIVLGEEARQRNREEVGPGHRDVAELLGHRLQLGGRLVEQLAGPVALRVELQGLLEEAPCALDVAAHLQPQPGLDALVGASGPSGLAPRRSSTPPNSTPARSR